MADNKSTVRAGASGDLWWMGVFAGILTMLFGVAALFWPGLTLVTFVYLFSAYVLVWGVVSVVRGFSDMIAGQSLWWLTLLFGFFAVGVGVYLVRHPLVSFATLILLTGFTFIIRGVVDILEGVFGDMPSSTTRILAVIAGALGIVAGIYLLNQPVSGGVAFVWIIGLYSLLVGPLLIALSMDSHKA
ncbi:MAG TPA: DUF308 domain-containing protein [Candidatus Saccharibacteria bacterium]|nr:DUF308 domain-containing protein [Candidatus Saccharibacteria bacterium]